MWGAILKFLIEHWETFVKLFRAAVSKLRKVIGNFKTTRKMPPWKKNGQKREEDSITEAFDLLIESGVSSTQELSDFMSRSKNDNAIRLPVLLDQLKKIDDLQLMSRILDPMPGDQSVKASVRELLNYQELKQWVKSFCDFATIYDSKRKFKNDTSPNIKSVYQKSLELLGYAFHRFQDIKEEEQNGLALKVCETFKKTLQKASEDKSEFPGLLFERIVAQIPCITEYITEQKLRHKVLINLANLIPSVLRELVVRPQEETAYVLMILSVRTETVHSDLFIIWQKLGGDEGCLFLRKIIENTVALEKYKEILVVNPKNGALIALSVNNLISECSAVCERNSKRVCDGTVRQYLRYWLYHNAGQLVLNNQEVYKELCKALVAIEQRTNFERRFLPSGRPLLKTSASINNPDESVIGKVRHTSKKKALFECKDEDSKAEVRKLLKRKDNQLEFTTNKRIIKPVYEIVECEPLRNPDDPGDLVYLFNIKFSKTLSDTEFEACKKYANDVLV